MITRESRRDLEEPMQATADEPEGLFGSSPRKKGKNTFISVIF